MAGKQLCETNQKTLQTMIRSKMLEYTITILEKVSFDGRLFRKEYRKALKHLNCDETEHLRKWLRSYVLVPVKSGRNTGKSDNKNL